MQEHTQQLLLAGAAASTNKLAVRCLLLLQKAPASGMQELDTCTELCRCSQVLATLQQLLRLLYAAASCLLLLLRHLLQQQGRQDGGP